MDNNDLAHDLTRINLEPVLSTFKGILKDFKVFESLRRPEMNSVKYYWLTLIVKSWKTHPEIFLKFSISGS